MSNIIEIEVLGVEYDLSDTKEAIEFLDFMLSEKNYSVNTGRIIKHILRLDQSEYLSRLQNFENPYYESSLDLVGFFSNYAVYNNNDNVLYKYLMLEGDSDLIKRQKLKHILSGLMGFMDWLWEFEGVSSIYFNLEKNGDIFHSKLKEESLLLIALPSYWIYENMKSIYDLMWDKFNLFIDKDDFDFQYKYSHNKLEKPTRIDEVQLNIVKLSREEIFKKLLDGDKNIRIFWNYEEKLIPHGYLSEDRNSWTSTPANFIRFYCYCEEKGLFKGFLAPTSKGVKLLRDLYQFHDGETIDSPTKRQKRLTIRTKGEFNYLDII